MQRLLCALIFCAGSLPLATGRTATRELDRSRQCVVVLTDNWGSTTGVMHAFERGGAMAIWKKRGAGIAVVLGKNGLGQGRGLVRLDFDGAPDKKEGDNRAPAGIFRLSFAFGYAPARSAARGRWTRCRPTSGSTWASGCCRGAVARPSGSGSATTTATSIFAIPVGRKFFEILGLLEIPSTLPS